MELIIRNAHLLRILKQDWIRAAADCLKSER
jgi:hypothetical protein